MRLRSLALPLLLLSTVTCAAGERPALRELRSVEELATAFEADAGRPRLLLLLSPT
jgi:hypothetical protein